LLEQVVMAAEEEREPRAELVDRKTPVQQSADVDLRVAEREGDLLRGGRAGFADVVAGDRDRMEIREMARRIFDRVGAQAKARLRRVDVGAARDELLQNVVLKR